MSESPQEQTLPFGRDYEITEVRQAVEEWVYNRNTEEQKTIRVETFRDQYGRFIRKNEVAAVRERIAQRAGQIATGIEAEIVPVPAEIPAKDEQLTLDLETEPSQEALAEATEDATADPLILEEYVIGFGGERMLHDTRGHGAFWTGIAARWHRRQEKPEPITPEPEHHRYEEQDLRALAVLWVNGAADAEQRIDEILAGSGVTDSEDVKAGLKLLATDTDDSWKDFDIEGAGETSGSQEEAPAQDPEEWPAAASVDNEGTEDQTYAELTDLAAAWRAAYKEGGTQLSEPIRWKIEGALMRQGVDDARVRSLLMLNMLRLPEAEPVIEPADTPAVLGQGQETLVDEVPAGAPRETWRTSTELTEEDISRGTIRDAVLNQDGEQFARTAPLLWERVRSQCIKTGDAAALQDLRIWLNDAFYKIKAGAVHSTEGATAESLADYVRDDPDADLIMHRYALLKKWGLGGMIWAHSDREAAAIIADEAQWKKFSGYAIAQGLAAAPKRPQPAEAPANTGESVREVKIGQGAAFIHVPIDLGQSADEIAVAAGTAQPAEGHVSSEPEQAVPVASVIEAASQDGGQPPIRRKPRFWHDWAKGPRRVFATSVAASLGILTAIGFHAAQDNDTRGSIAIEADAPASDGTGDTGAGADDTPDSVPDNAQPPVPTTEAEAAGSEPEPDESDVPPATKVTATTLASLITAPPTVPGTGVPTTTEAPITTSPPASEAPAETSPAETETPTTTAAPTTTQVPATDTPVVTDVLDQSPATEASEEVPATTPPAAPTDPAQAVTYTFTVEEQWRPGNPTAWSWARGLGVPEERIPDFLTEVMGADWAMEGQAMQVGDSLSITADVLSKYVIPGLPAAS